MKKRFKIENCKDIPVCSKCGDVLKSISIPYYKRIYTQISYICGNCNHVPIKKLAFDWGYSYISSHVKRNAYAPIYIKAFYRIFFKNKKTI